MVDRRSSHAGSLSPSNSDPVGHSHRDTRGHGLWGPLGTPTLRLRGDYLAIVTLGFALIIDDFVETKAG